MRLHLKLMALLVAFGLFPTLIVGLYGRTALHNLGDDLAARGRTAITERLTNHMAETIRQAASVLDHRRIALEMTLRAQAAEVARRLDRTPEADGGALPPSLVPADRHPPGASMSALHGLPVSRQALSIRVAPQAVPGPALAQARALADLPAPLATLDTGLDGGVLWHFVITADGLQATWPAHGPPTPAPPAGSDPRLRPWFAHALETGQPVWTAPHPDPLTGQLVLTAGMPVLDAGGTVTAVTGLHVSVMAGARVLQGQADLPRDTVGMLVMPQVGNTGAAELRLLATSRFPTTPGTAWAPAGDDPTTAERPRGDPAFQAMIDTLAAGGSGTVRLPYQGKPALWAYGALPGSGVAVIYVVPFERLDAIARGVAAMAQDATAGQLAATGGVIFVVFGLAGAGAWVGARQVAQPLRALGQAMERVAAGDMSARAPVTSGDEVGEAARRFNEMVPLLEDRLGLRQALDLAQDVQQALLPAAAPDLPGFDLAGASVYSDATGGDYFDYVPVGPPGRWAVMVGDVSGHGISAALLMTTIRAMLRARLPGCDSPAELLRSVNPLLAEDVSAGRFMTLFCLFLEADRREILWSSAGHGDCHVFAPDTGTLEPLKGEDIPLGIDPAWTFEPSQCRTLRSGEILLLGTDGLLEARDEAGRDFGTAGLRAAMTAYLGESAAPNAKGLCDALLTACADHRGGRPPRDDTTLVVLRVL